MIYSYFDVIDRSNSGPQVKKADWDMEHVVLPTRAVVKKYDLKWDKHSIVPHDPAMMDRLFDAALELAETTGVYCINTERVIQFSREELEEGLSSSPKKIIMGSGKDARKLHARGICDSKPPLVWAGNPGVPTPEELFLPMVMSWMQEPVVDMVTCGSVVTVDGRPVETGTPSEIFAVRRELRLLRDGLARVGRPDMGMLAAQSAVSSLGDLAAAHPNYLRSHDSHLVAMFNELMIDQDNMSRAANSIETGFHNASLATVMVGGLAGDGAGAAVVQAASFILANHVCRADYHLLHPIHIRHVATSTRGVMWVQGAVEQAFARNSPSIIVSDIYPKSGAGTTELLYEVAANAIAITVSGGHLEGVGSADGAHPNCSGLEARLMGEVGHAVTKQGLDLAQAEDLIQKILMQYEHVFSQPEGNPGKRFDYVYDLKTLRPIREWEQIYMDVKQKLNQFGLNI
ncbi:MAG: monomethylamine:corrinoid methyltransferase [Anaerolineaceae bacterium]